MNGGTLIAKELTAQGVKFIFTLCGGHISPILSGCKSEGIRVIDVRNEANAVFAADAVSRCSGIPGVAAVTAGPGVTNTITAVKNASMAQSPLILIGGATATALRGRGALQDIDQMKLMKPHVKWAISVKHVRDLVPAVKRGFRIAQDKVPGPVFIECPVDLLYDEDLVREWYGAKADDTPAKSFADKMLKIYLRRHVKKLFKNKDQVNFSESVSGIGFTNHSASDVKKVQTRLKKSEKPVMLIGSQAVLNPKMAEGLAKAISAMNIPVYLSGMARGLLGADHPLQVRHKRRLALKEADLILLAGVPCDFRLDYGRHIRPSAYYISINRSRKDLNKNKRPNTGVHSDPGTFLTDLSSVFIPDENKLHGWIDHLKKRDGEREAEISQKAEEKLQGINPIELFREMDKILGDNSILIADGGDFVATSAYTLKPRKPLSWLDPGVFGTLGVGAGFALGAKLCNPDSEVWIIYGDGSSAYSLAEYDTFHRHEIPVISVVGNDASWAQIAREQIEILHDDVATVLAYSDYDKVAVGYGGEGEKVNTINEFQDAIEKARLANSQKKPYLINAIISKTDFRKGSISM